MAALRDALGDLPKAVFADLLESEDSYLLVVDLPGATADTVDVTAQRGRLQIEARREKALPEGFHFRREERSLFLDAELPLPPDASGADAEGSVERGVLTLSLPKTESSAGSDIPIEDAQA